MKMKRTPLMWHIAAWFFCTVSVFTHRPTDTVLTLLCLGVGQILDRIDRLDRKRSRRMDS